MMFCLKLVSHGHLQSLNYGEKLAAIPHEKIFHPAFKSLSQKKSTEPGHREGKRRSRDRTCYPWGGSLARYPLVFPSIKFSMLVLYMSTFPVMW